ncbi:hypothetical protein QJQ45_006353 [Haematococcus lacustris]|nr:hypothetical protein QJQ45_006353 [Haematococcus lacustris]
MLDLKPGPNLIWATSKLPSCREDARQLLSLFAARAQEFCQYLMAVDISNIFYSTRLMLWLDKEVCRQLAERAVLTQQTMKNQEMANSLYGLARFGYLDSSMCSLAAGVAKADLTASNPQDLANLLYAKSMFLALSIHQALSSGHSQLASELQLNSMAATMWRECSRRGQSEWQWGKENIAQYTTNMQENTIVKLLSEGSQLVQALADAGRIKVPQAVLSQDRAQLLVLGPGLTQGIAVDQTPHFLYDGSMAGVVAFAKLRQLNRLDAGVIVNEVVFDQLASDSEQAASLWEHVRASLPEAEAWRQLPQAEKEHCAGQVEAPAAAPPAAPQAAGGQRVS